MKIVKCFRSSTRCCKSEIVASSYLDVERQTGSPCKGGDEKRTLHKDANQAGVARAPRLSSKRLQGASKADDNAEAGQTVVEPRQVPGALVQGAQAAADENGLDHDVAVAKDLGDGQRGSEMHETGLRVWNIWLDG